MIYIRHEMPMRTLWTWLLYSVVGKLLKVLTGGSKSWERNLFQRLRLLVAFSIPS